jgi:hypothetical protein
VRPSSKLEAGKTDPKQATVHKLRRALERVGIVFQDADDEEWGPNVGFALSSARHHPRHNRGASPLNSATMRIGDVDCVLLGSTSSADGHRPALQYTFRKQTTRRVCDAGQPEDGTSRTGILRQLRDGARVRSRGPLSRGPGGRGRGTLPKTARSSREKWGTSPVSIQQFDRAITDPKLATARKWRRALERAGVVIIDPDHEMGPGVGPRDRRKQ